MSAKAQVEVALAIIERDECVLVAQRPHDTVLPGLWEFPGGKLHPGEDARDAVRREVREELGIDIAVGEHLTSFEHDYPYARVRLHCYHCHVVDGEPEPLSSVQVKWAPMEKLREMNFPPANDELLALVESLPAKRGDSCS